MAQKPFNSELSVFKAFSNHSPSNLCLILFKLPLRLFGNKAFLNIPMSNPAPFLLPSSLLSHPPESLYFSRSKVLLQSFSCLSFELFKCFERSCQSYFSFCELLNQFKFSIFIKAETLHWITAHIHYCIEESADIGDKQLLFWENNIQTQFLLGF